MPKEEVFSCGWNAFSQLTCLLGCSVSNSGTSNEKMFTSPILIGQIQEGRKLLHISFTWDRIAVSISHINTSAEQKRPSTTTTVSGFVNCSKDCPMSTNTKDENWKSYQDKVVVASTDTGILLVEDSNDSTRLCLLQSGRNDVRCFIGADQLPKEMQCFGGSHKDFFAYDGLNFVKLSLPQGFVHPSESNSQDKETPLTIPLVHIDSSVKFTTISCGKEHVLLLSEYGTVYSYGLGSRGQLGHGTVEEETSPKLVEALEGIPVTNISAGGWHSAAISADGDLYLWGWNESGQLGLAALNTEVKGRLRRMSTSLEVEDELVGIQAEPRCTDLSTDINVAAVACGSRHTVCLTTRGRIFTCGWNGYGQLGLGHHDSLDQFTQVQLTSKCTKIFAGQWNSVFVCSPD